MESAREGVAAELRQSGVSLDDRLQVAPNLSGVGILVFVRPQVGCDPQYAWLTVAEDRTYALTEESRALTPHLPLLNQAPDKDRHVSGSSQPRFLEDLRRQVCRPPRHG